MTGRGARVLLPLVLAALLLAAAPAPAPSWLGVRIRDLTEQEMDDLSAKHGLREGFGAVVVEVIEDTPAARAGLKNGDIIVAFDDQPVVDAQTLQHFVAAAPAGQEARLTVLRPAGRRPVPVRLVAMPRVIAGDRVAATFGFALAEAPGAGELAGAPRVATAPVVSFVLHGSPAERAGLETGDVVLQVGEQAVVSREAAREALADRDGGRPLRLTVRRGEEQLSLTLAHP